MALNSSSLFNKETNLIVWGAIIVFTFFYLFLSYNNRLVSDDIYLLNLQAEYGKLGAIREFNYNKRIVSHLLFHLFFPIEKGMQHLGWHVFLFQITLFLGFSSALFFFIRNTFTYLHARISQLDTWMITFLIFIAFFFGSFQLAELWFWTISSCVHLFPLIAVLFIAGIFILKQHKWYHFLLLVTSLPFLFGGSETIGLACLSCSAFFFCVLIKKKKITSSHFLLTVLLLICGTLHFYSLFSFEGAQERISLELTSINQYPHTIHDFIRILVQPKNSIPIIIGVLLFIGTQRSGIFRRIRSSEKNILFIFFLLIVLSTFVPLFFVFKNAGPPRAWSFLGLTLSLLLLGAISLTITIPKSFSSTASIAISSLLFIGISTYAYRQVNMTTTYRKAYDDRLELLITEKQKKRRSPLALSPLPDSGMLINNDLEADTLGWNNQQLANSLQLGFRIYESE